MKIEAFLVASTVNIAMAQRLVRKICVFCKEEVRVTQGFVESIKGMEMRQPFVEGDVLYKGKGCMVCNGSGYKGRICINEVLVADNEIREAILNRASSTEIRRIAIKNGMTSMLEDGLIKARRGETTVEEILRVVYE